jgi:hypothetical protein
MEAYPSPQVARSNIMASLLTRRPQIRIDEQYLGEDYKSIQLTPSLGQSILLEHAQGLDLCISSKPANLRLVDCSRIRISLVLGCVSSIELLRCSQVTITSATDGAFMVSVEHSREIQVQLPPGDAKLLSIASTGVSVKGRDEEQEVRVDEARMSEVLVQWDKVAKCWKVGELIRDQQRGGVPVFEQ